MKTKKFTIEDNLNNLIDGQSMLNRLIDSQINNYKSQCITDWERNHKASSERNHQKIEELMRIKRDLKQLFNYEDETNKELLFKLNIEVTVKDQQHSPASMRPLIHETA